MKITSINNVAHKGAYRTVGLNNQDDANKKYDREIQRNNIWIDGNIEKINELTDEIKVFNNNISELEASRALLNQAIYHMNSSEIQEKIANLPNDKTITFYTISKSSLAQDAYSAPFLACNNAHETLAFQYANCYTFETDKDARLDVQGLNDWLDSIE